MAKAMCSVADPEGHSKSGGHTYGMCPKHYQRWKRHGDPMILKGPSPAGFTNKTCRADDGDCDKPTQALGYCSMHYRRWNLYGSTDLPVRLKKPVPECKIEECRDPVECRGWCNKHYLRWQKWGDPLAFKPSEIKIFCSEDGCCRRRARGGVCWKHYRYFKAKFMAEQDGKCKICGIPEDRAPRKMFHLDHDHVTDRPRALLCHHCNCGIGHFKEDPERLSAAIRYLAETKPGQLALFVA
jgi:Recombination endonuclease VII